MVPGSMIPFSGIRMELLYNELVWLEYGERDRARVDKLYIQHLYINKIRTH